jgi:GT2 family glycosyltransferase
MPKTSLIIINYNGAAVVGDCLRALGGQSLLDFELILVDNNSSDGSLEYIRQFFRDNPVPYPVQLIPLDRNTGFPGGNIAGLESARGEYIALLNNDAVPDPRWLEELVSAMDGNPGAGICASRLICMGTDIVDSAGDGYATSLKGFKRGEGQPADGFADRAYVFGACAGAALYRREMIDQIGFLDDDYFLIHEDTDLNFRAQLAGWKVLYVPSAIAFHKVHASIGRMSDTAVYYTLRNSDLTRIKDVPFGLFVRLLPQFVLGVITEFFYFVIKHGRFRTFFRAKIDFLKLVPRMLKKRRAVMRMKKVPNSYILSIMTPVFEKEFFRMKLKKFLRA